MCCDFSVRFFFELLAVGIRNPFLVVLQVPFIVLDFDSRVC